MAFYVRNDEQKFVESSTATSAFLRNKEGRLEKVNSTVLEAVKAGTNKNYVIVNEDKRFESPVAAAVEEEPDETPEGSADET